MKNKIIFTLLILTSLVLVACKSEGPVIGDDNFAILEYPDFAETPEDKNSIL